MQLQMYYLKKRKATTPALRFQQRAVTKCFSGIEKYDRFTIGSAKHSGKNNIGQMTVLHRGGGHVFKQTHIDFYNRFNGVATLVCVKKDPIRSALIGMFINRSGLIFNRLLSSKAKVGQAISISSKLKKYKLRQGFCLPLICLPKRKLVHGIELFFGQKSSLIRAAGSKATIIKKFKNGYVLVKLKTGELRFINGLCMASLGQVSNTRHHMRIQGKAGLNKWLNIRPHVRGVAMNPIDHPHGGGQGKSKGGKPAVSPYGKQAKGPRTRKTRTKFIAYTRRFRTEKK